jgi:hypothetical protein
MDIHLDHKYLMSIDVVYEVLDHRQLDIYLIFIFIIIRKKPHNLQVEEIIKRSTINLIIAITSLVEMDVCRVSECLCMCK